MGRGKVYRLPLACTPTGYQTCNLHALTEPGIKPATFQGTGWHTVTGPAARPTAAS